VTTIPLPATDAPEPEKSHRSVNMHDPEEARCAASYLEREWGSGRRLGYAGRWTDSYGRSWAVWQCAAGDGSRWLIRSDRYGNVGTFETSLEREIGALLDVEVS
jgi:hypothetical protein